MADKTIRESFFDAKAIGSLWDVAVSLKRGNPLPIDADSVFESEAKLIEYIGDKITTVAYPGQVVAVVNADSTQIFYIDQELNYHPVGAKLDTDGKSIKVDNNVLKLVGFDEAADGLLAQVKVDAQGNRTLNWVSIETIAQGDGNTTYTFTGLDKESNVYFEVKASDVDAATKIYLDTYTKKEIDDKFAALTDNDTTYTFVDGTEGKFTVTPKNGEAIEVDTGAKEIVNALDKKVTDAGYQNASDVSTAITTALTDYYNKAAIDGKVEDLEGKISAIPKFAIEVVSELPTENISGTTVYLVPDNDSKTSDVYDEFIYVNGNWELLGKQTLDLTGYATETFVTTEIGKLSLEGGAIKTVADELALLEEAHNGLADDVAELEKIDHDKIAKDAADAAVEAHTTAVSHLTTTDVDGQIDAKITAHNSAKDHFTAEEIATQVAGILSTENYEGKIATAKQEAIDAALIKSVDEEQFTVTDGKLTLDAIAQDKVTGLAEALAGIYTKEEVDNALDTKLEGVSVNGVALAVADNIVDIPAATAEKFGVVKLGSEFETDEDGALEVKELNVNKLVQTEGDVLVLNGGLASNLING